MTQAMPHIPIPTADQHTLMGTYYPAIGTPRAHMVLHSATGVPQRYYRAFATWMSRQGIGVLTYDYRDFGASRTGSLKGSPTTMATWCLLDQAAAEAKLATLAPKGPLWLMGHSIGGLGFPFRTLDARFERVMTVGAGFTYVADHPWHYLPLVLMFWYGVGPMTTLLAGYMPGKRILLGADLPAGVYWQWRRWCTNPRFFADDFGKALPEPHFKNTPYSLSLFTMEDDAVVPPVAVKRFAESFPKEAAQYSMLYPKDYAYKSLGHIEILSEKSAAAWPVFLNAPKA